MCQRFLKWFFNTENMGVAIVDARISLLCAEKTEPGRRQLGASVVGALGLQTVRIFDISVIRTKMERVLFLAFVLRVCMCMVGGGRWTQERMGPYYPPV
jgi:hypothetical protein